MRMNSNRTLLSVALLLGYGLAVLQPAGAAVIQTPADFNSPPGIVTGDLLETSATLTTQFGNFVHEGGLGPSALNDGVFNPAQSGVTTPDTGNFLVYTFDTTSTPLGYEVTSIISSGGWADDGRDRQNYTISYTTVDNPALQLLAAVSYEPGTNYSSVTLTDNVTGVLISGLATLRIDFPNQENNYAGYGEFDIIGSAIVLPAPEPTTLSMLGLGICALSRLRRRHQLAAHCKATT